MSEPAHPGLPPQLAKLPPTPPADPDVRELRLALVCYGGVSLAIYMHGITKELEKLVRASDRLVTLPPGAANPFTRPGERSERAYFDALQAKARREGCRTRVVVDVVSGTSAGGINGVCLAKAVANDLPQDALRDLWLDKAAILKLLRFALPPLAGNRMLAWIGGAFARMEKERKGATLLPPGLALELFVTTTDLHGYPRGIPIADPPTVDSVVNKVVLRFAHRDGAGNLDAAHDAALGLAARASSSFPGAFPPVRIADVGPPQAQTAFAAEFCGEYALANFPVAKTWFVDGGVLDNYPFRSAVRAIPGKPAATQVDRKLLYIEPDPARGLEPPTGARPRLLRTVWAALSTLPRRQPIADALDELAAYNERVRRLKQMVSALRPSILAVVLPVLEAAPTFQDANAAVNQGAIAANTVAFQGYLRLKLLSVVEGMADALCGLLGYPQRSEQGLFVRETLVRWAESRGLLGVAAGDGGALTPDQVDFLRTFDLGYGRRRIRFVIGRASELYGEVDRDTLNRLKHALYELLYELETVLDRDGADNATELATTIFAPAALHEYLDGWAVDAFRGANAGALDDVRGLLGEALHATLGDFNERVWRAVEDGTAELPPAVRGDLRSHYLGFPYWDAATYPARMLAGVVELDEVEVFRASPLDATRLGVPGREKLRGVALGHFGGFFDRGWRENDYLWGRLDGAERLLKLVGDESDDSLAAAFGAIAAEERPVLTTAGALLDRAASFPSA
ncbi:MAG TPA: patatin-like protein [Gaiellaceae bacterium]|nr:patatin-like protein [Gaiellaceae bacterium]